MSLLMMNQEYLLILLMPMVLKLYVKVPRCAPMNTPKYYRTCKIFEVNAGCLTTVRHWMSWSLRELTVSTSNYTTFFLMVPYFYKTSLQCFCEKKPVLHENQCGNGNEEVMANLIPRSGRLCSANRHTHPSSNYNY